MEDVGRTRVHCETPVLVEAALAVGPLRGNGGRGGENWVRRARTALAAVPVVRSDLEGTQRLAPAVLPALLEASGREGDGVPGPVTEEVRWALSVLGCLHRTVLAPVGAGLRGQHSTAGGRLGRTMNLSGVLAGLESLGARVHSGEGIVLSVDDGEDRQVSPEGNGLVLMPSVFLEDTPRLVHWRVPRADDDDSVRTVLLFPARGPGEHLDTLLSDTVSEAPSLGRLLGKTRSVILARLVAPFSTGELAALLYVSPTVISEHTAILREAGLITTAREGNRTRHLATDFGLALLGRGIHAARTAPHRASRARGRRARLAESA